MNLASLKIPALAAMAALLSPIAVLSAEQSSSQQQRDKGKLTRQQNPNHLRSHAMCIEFEYVFNEIQFYPSSLYSVAEVTVTNPERGIIVSSEISESNGYVVETGELHGDVQITCEIENGALYVGSIFIE